MKEVESIELVLENCESITVKRKYIGDFWCDDITSTVARIAMNSISKYQKCKEFFLSLHKDADGIYNSFGSPSKSTVFTRLTDFPDITSVNVKYKDGSEEMYFVPWEDADESGSNNCYQTSFISKCGHIYIYIGERPMEEAIDLDMESLNSSECMDAYWDLLSE